MSCITETVTYLFQVLELHSQLAKAQAAEGLANGRLKNAEETNKVKECLDFNRANVISLEKYTARVYCCNT